MSPRTNKENEKIRQESKKNIMAAALELFANYGYHNTSISKVAKAAGVSKGLTYNYFESKEALLTAVIQSLIQEGMDIGDELLQASDKLEPKVLLKMMIDQFFELLTKDKERMKLTLSLTMQAQNIPSVHDLLQGIYITMLKQLETILELNGYEQPALEAQLFGALFDGIGIQSILFEDELRLAPLKQLIEAKYLA